MASSLSRLIDGLVAPSLNAAWTPCFLAAQPPALCAVLADANNQTVALYESISELYPHGKEVSANIDTLLSKGDTFKNSKDAIEEARAGVEAAYNAVAARHKDLAKMADDRASLRQDIMHYTEKVGAVVCAECV